MMFFTKVKKELHERKSDIQGSLGLTINYSSRYILKNSKQKLQLVLTLYNYFGDIINSAATDLNKVAPNSANSKLLSIYND